MGRTPKIKPGNYTLKMKKGKGNAWNWEIRDARNELWSWGARTGERAEVEAHCQKALHRLNHLDSAPWQTVTRKPREAA